MRLIASALSVALLCVGIWCVAQADGINNPTATAAPSGTAGGDLGGTYPDPTVVNGSNITNSSIPNSGLATPAPCSAFGTVAGACAQGGVITAGGPTGGATTVPVITYNAAGQLTAVTTAATGVTAVGTAAVGQIPASTTNAAASAGKVGEIVVSGTPLSSLGTGATVTITIATPAVISWAANPFFNANATGNGCASALFFTNSGGALPTGITGSTTYYVTCDATFTANAFHISTSVANAIAGTALNTSGTQSGTQTGQPSIVLTSPTAQDGGGMSLTAGDWDVETLAAFFPGSITSITILNAGVSAGSAETGNEYSRFYQTFAASVPNGTIIMNASPQQLPLLSTTTVFCGIGATFSVSSLGGSIYCRARRMR